MVLACIVLPLTQSQTSDCVQNDNTQAALYMQKALEASPDSIEYAADLERLLRRIPESHSQALQVPKPLSSLPPSNWETACLTPPFLTQIKDRLKPLCLLHFTNSSKVILHL